MLPTVTLTRKYTFCAAHQLYRSDWDTARNDRHFGICVRLHGHHYTLEITLAGTPDPETGMIFDLWALDALIRTTLLDHVDHHNLDGDVPFLAGTLSTLENLATVFFRRLAPEFPETVRLERLRLYEDDAMWADVTADESN